MKILVSFLAPMCVFIFVATPLRALLRHVVDYRKAEFAAMVVGALAGMAVAGLYGLLALVLVATYLGAGLTSWAGNKK